MMPGVLGGARLNLAEVLLDDVGGRASRVALRERQRSWTYAELAETTARVGGALLSLGIGARDRVCVLMPDGLEAAAAILGTIWIGGVAVPISELGRPNDIRALVRDAAASVVVVHASLEPVLDEIRREVTTVREVVVVGGPAGGARGERDFAMLVAQAAPALPKALRGEDPALILYSAGASRGVLHSQQGPLASFASYARGVLKMDEDDRVFATVKLATAYGLGAGLLFPLAAGAEAILLPDQPTSRAVFSTLHTFKPTVFFATPSIYSQLLADCSANPSVRPLEGLRVCVSGAEVLPEPLRQRVREQLGTDVLCGYGLTEAFHFVLAGGPRMCDGAIGKVIPGYEARVVGEDGATAGPREIGALEVSGPSLAIGYWNLPEATAQTFRGEWLHTGDRFFVDPDGCFFYCGRADDLFKVGGKWVSPAEVEEALLGHEAVWECAVVGVEDPDGLTKPLAFVVPNVGHAPSPELEAELIAYVKREIAPYKYPRWIEFIDALPKGPHGKVLRYKLLPPPMRRSAAEPASDE